MEEILRAFHIFAEIRFLIKSISAVIVTVTSLRNIDTKARWTQHLMILALLFISRALNLTLIGLIFAVVVLVASLTQRNALLAVVAHELRRVALDFTLRAIHLVRLVETVDLSIAAV